MGLPAIPDDCRTVMVKNVPYKVREEELLVAFREKGFDTHEHYHVPRKPGKNDTHMGYAFISFSTPEETKRFAIAMTGHQFSCSNQKTLAVVPAKYEGADPRSDGKKAKRNRKQRALTAPGDCSDSDGAVDAPPKDVIKTGKQRRKAPLAPDELARLDSLGNS